MIQEMFPIITHHRLNIAEYSWESGNIPENPSPIGPSKR
jgi:hypothetical protein